MKKRSQVSLLGMCVLAVTAMFASLSTGAYAGMKASQHHYKGEIPCPPQLILKDGLYFGVAAGYDAYRVVNDVDFVSENEIIALDLDPRLSVNGAVGGALLGFGRYFDSFYNTYLGFEIFGNGSGAGSSAAWLVNAVGSSYISEYSTDIQVKSNYGLSLLPGIKLNKATLFYVRLGYNWTNIDVNEYVVINQGLVASSNYDVTSSGFNYGLGMEAAVVPNVSLRGEYTHTDYSDFTTYLDTKIRPEDNQFMLALIFHFD